MAWHTPNETPSLSSLHHAAGVRCVDKHKSYASCSLGLLCFLASFILLYLSVKRETSHNAEVQRMYTVIANTTERTARQWCRHLHIEHNVIHALTAHPWHQPRESSDQLSQGWTTRPGKCSVRECMTCSPVLPSSHCPLFVIVLLQAHVATKLGTGEISGRRVPYAILGG